jgi:hypothetical protein
VATLPLRARPAYKALAEHYAKIEGRHLRELFDEDPTRGERLCAEAVGLYLDYSNNRVTDETLDLLLQLAEQSDLEERRDLMFAGARINVSENRSVLHVALRMPKGSTLIVDGVDVVAQVHDVLDRMSGQGFEVVLMLGTGLGTAFVLEGKLLPHFEVSQHPYGKGQTYNEAIGEAARKKIGRKRSRNRVHRVIESIRLLTFYDRCFVGGGDASRPDPGELPSGVTVVSNDAGITGGIKLWQGI